MVSRAGTRLAWSLFAGVVLTVAASPFALLPPIPWVLFVPAVFLTGTVVWYAMASEETVSLRRGALAGASTGVFSHVSFWVTVVVVDVAQGAPVSDPLGDVQAVLVLSLLGIVFAGAFTVAVGAVAGVVVAFVQSRYGPSERTRPETAAAGP